AIVAAIAGRHDPHPVVAVVRDNQVPRGVERYAGRDGQPGADGRAAVAGESLGAGPGDRVDVAGGHLLAVERAILAGDHPDHAVAGVGDDQVPGAVRRHALRVVERGAGGRAAVAGVPGGAGPGDRVDVAAGHLLAVERAVLAGDHPDHAVAAVGDDQVSVGVRRDADRGAQPGAGGRAAVAGVPGGAGPRHGVDV